LTSAGADRLVNVWNEAQINAQQPPPPMFSFDDHISTVKAVEYIPFLGGLNCNFVATGGGANDHTVKVWNLSTGTIHSSLDTENKVSECWLLVYPFFKNLHLRFRRFFSTRSIGRWQLLRQVREISSVSMTIIRQASSN
jgi:WD40 repeat protein